LSDALKSELQLQFAPTIVCCTLRMQNKRLDPATWRGTNVWMARALTRERAKNALHLGF